MEKLPEGKQPALRVVLMSGYDEERANRELDGLRPEAFLHKPFTPSMLLRAVSAVLEAADGGGRAQDAQRSGA